MDILNNTEVVERLQKEQLDRLYRKNKYSIKKVAKLFDETPEWVESKLQKHNIPLRVRSIAPRRGNGRNESYDYIRIKVNGEWVPEHRYVWEQANGPLPKGWIIHHLNGIKDDNRLENLLAMPRSKHKTAFIEEATRNRILTLENEVKELRSIVNIYESYIFEAEL